MASMKDEPDEEYEGLSFVNISHPDDINKKDTQRAIRQRVMKGIGRSRRKRPLTLTFLVHNSSEVITPLEDLATTTPAVNSRAACSWSEKVPRSLDSHSLFPVEPSPRALQLLHYMHSEADYVYRPFRVVWFTMAITDRSAFNLLLANAALCLDQMKKPDSFEYGKCRESLTYYGACVAQVIQRLGDKDESASEGVIATVLGLICHDLYFDIKDRLAVHIAGLEYMIFLRGGFMGLSSNIPLFAFWFDVLISASQDSCPRFPIPHDLVHSAPHGELSQSLKILIFSLTETSSELCELANALERVGYVVDFVNKHAHQPQFWRQENDLVIIKLIGPAAHFLLSMQRLSESEYHETPDPFMLLKEVVRVALLILLAGLQNALSLKNELGPLQEKFSRLLLLASISDSLFPELRIWAIATVASFKPKSNNHWLTEEICRAVMELEATTGNGYIEVAKNIMWIEKLPKHLDWFLS